MLLDELITKLQRAREKSGNVPVFKSDANGKTTPVEGISREFAGDLDILDSVDTSQWRSSTEQPTGYHVKLF